MALVEDDEPALLLVKFDKDETKLMLLDEKRVVPSLLSKNKEITSESNLWYLDNRASNHMTGFKMKFKNLDKRVTG